MEAFKGKFVLVSAEQYDQFLKAIGVGFLLRKAIPCFTPEITITEVEGGLWKVKTSTIFKTFEIEFKLNEEFDETTPDGRAHCLSGVPRLKKKVHSKLQSH